MLKTIILSGLGKTNVSEAEYDRATPVANKKWTLLEVRPYFSATHNANELYLYKATERFKAVNSQIVNRYWHPYPTDTVIESGIQLRLTGITSGAVTDMIVEIIINEV